MVTVNVDCLWSITVTDQNTSHIHSFLAPDRPTCRVAVVRIPVFPFPLSSAGNIPTVRCTPITLLITFPSLAIIHHFFLTLHSSSSSTPATFFLSQCQQPLKSPLLEENLFSSASQLVRLRKGFKFRFPDKCIRLTLRC